MRTPLFYATVQGGLSGLLFPIGEALCFTTMDDPTLYQITDPQVLTLRQPVEAAMAAFLAETILEPRLLALTGGGR